MRLLEEGGVIGASEGAFGVGVEGVAAGVATGVAAGVVAVVEGVAGTSCPAMNARPTLSWPVFRPFTFLFVATRIAEPVGVSTTVLR